MNRGTRLYLCLIAIAAGVAVYFGSFCGLTREQMGSGTFVFWGGIVAGIALALLLMEANDAGDFQSWWNYGAGRPWWAKDLLVLSLVSVFVHGLILFVSYPGIPHWVDGRYIMQAKGQFYVLSEIGYQQEQADVLRLLAAFWVGFFAELAARMRYPRPRKVSVSTN